eukprot:scpid75365/ scgid30071/ 
MNVHHARNGTHSEPSYNSTHSEALRTHYIPHNRNHCPAMSVRPYAIISAVHFDSQVSKSILPHAICSLRTTEYILRTLSAWAASWLQNPTAKQQAKPAMGQKHTFLMHGGEQATSSLPSVYLRPGLSTCTCIL